MTDDREAWQEAYEAGDLRKEEFATLSFSEVPALGLPDGPVPARISYPGQFPYTRGVHPTGYRGRLWTQREFAGFAGVADTNERFRYLLDAGQGGLSVAFDMPTLMGLDADDALAVGEVGHCGVAVSSSDDMVDLFDGIPLGEVSVSMTINGPAEVLFAFLLVRPRSKGSIGGHCEGPSRTTSSRNTSLRRSGSSLQSRIWARWMRERYGARDERSLKLRFHTQTAGVSLTAQQPDNNVVRTAIEALAAVLDGTQSLHTNALDEVYALPTAKTAEIALRTQQIIAEETGAADTIDPLGRSWFVEAMTDDMETRAEEIFAHIGAMGSGSMLDGVLAGIADGWFQEALADSAYEFAKAVASGDRMVVGVNKHVNTDETPLEILRVSQEVEAGMRARLATLRRDRELAQSHRPSRTWRREQRATRT